MKNISFILLFVFTIVFVSCTKEENKSPLSEKDGKNVTTLPEEDQIKYNAKSISILADFTKVLNDFSAAMVSAKTGKQAADLMQLSYDSFLTFTPRMKEMDSLYPTITSMDSTNVEVQKHIKGFQESMFRYNEATKDLSILFGNDEEFKKMVKEMEERNSKPLK